MSSEAVEKGQPLVRSPWFNRAFGGKLQIGILVLSFTGFVVLPGCQLDQRDGVVEPDFQRIKNIRNMLESSIFTINGVESISIGLCDNGRPCLQISSSVPVEQVRPRLPAGLSQIQVELLYVGKV